MKNTKENTPFYFSEEMPHNGELLKKHIDASPLNQTRIAERIGITSPALMSYYNKYTLHTKALWRASLALEHNFLLDLGMRLPIDFVSERETELQKQIDGLQQENERLKIELSVYEKIIKR